MKSLTNSKVAASMMPMLILSIGLCEGDSYTSGKLPPVSSKLVETVLEDDLESQEIKALKQQISVLQSRLDEARDKLADLATEPAGIPFEIADVIIESTLVVASSGAIEISPIIYDYRKAVNYPQRERVLREVRDLIKANPRVKIRIMGHADDFPHHTTNKVVSKNRAKYLADWLFLKGVPRQNITGIDALANTQPLKSGPNRRVEFLIEP